MYCFVQLKQKCHVGIPPQLRCAVWTASVVRIANPHQPIQTSDSYGTFGEKKKLDSGWETVLNTVFPNEEDRDGVVAPDLGLTREVLHRLITKDYNKWNQSNSRSSVCIPSSGVNSLSLVLSAVQQVLGIDYCPLLPDITTVLLTHMSESYAYATIREMINDSSHFLPVCQKDYYSWCKSYEVFVKKMFPQHYKVMNNVGALSPEGLEPIFKRFFITLLKREDVLQFMDIFVVEGCKAIFRLALSLNQLISKSDLKAMHLIDSEAWWNEIMKKTRDPSFSFKKQVDIMYPKFGKLSSRQSKRYPRRHILKRAISYHRKWALVNMPVYVDQTPPKPLGFISSDKPIILAKPTSVRANLAKWLTTSLKSTRLDLIYSTEVHGRSLAALYKECRRTKHTIILVEAITGDISTTIGMFASQAWVVNPSCFGDGECFLFRVDPAPKCFNWTPDVSGSFDDNIESDAIREQFMVARNEFIAMGANSDGTNGLRLDADLNNGESYTALGFDNEPLAGKGRERFDIGTVEVYRLMWEVGGTAIDGDDNLIWNLQGM